MTEEEFRNRYNLDRPQLRAWGELVSDRICTEINNHFGGSVSCETFLKIPPLPRLKTESSILGKAFRRNKQYANPYEGITDKVGVRFVVLLLRDIKVVTDIIEYVTHWEASKDRDFQIERERNPLLFDYQSEHYVVRAKPGQSFNNVSITSGLPCEIQVRTLLQHAYSEMAHDSVYKPSVRTDPIILRQIARSMALIETTDDVFCDVSSVLTKRAEYLSEYEASLEDLYHNLTGIDAVTSHAFTAQVLEAFAQDVESITMDILGNFFQNQPGLVSTIEASHRQKFIYSQPTILLMYYLIDKSHHRFRANWTGSDSDILPLFTDLGISLSH